MKAILFLILTTASIAASAARIALAPTVVKICQDGLQIQKLDPTPNNQNRYVASLSMEALRSVASQLGLRNNFSELQNFELTSSSWGEFAGKISTGDIYLHELNNGKSVLFQVENSRGEQIANYYFSICN